MLKSKAEGELVLRRLNSFAAWKDDGLLPEEYELPDGKKWELLFFRGARRGLAEGLDARW